MKAFQNTKPQDFEIFDDFSLSGEESPYAKVIEVVNYLDQESTPNQKFKLLTKIKEEIIKAIDSYWEKQDS